jgi:hypothetical protein
MKVIFIDIDGVLNCKGTPNPRKLPYVADPKLVRRFRQLLERSGAKAVLSSTWRYDPAGLFSALDTLPLFQPSPSTGLTPAIATGVAKYLAGKTDQDMRRNAIIRLLQNVRASMKSHEG